MTLIANVFLKLRTPKNGIRCATTQYLLTINMVNAPEHCSNLKDGSFTIFIDYCEDN